MIRPRTPIAALAFALVAVLAAGCGGTKSAARDKWSYYRGELTFEIVEVADAGSRVIYTAHPWRRIE